MSSSGIEQGVSVVRSLASALAAATVVTVAATTPEIDIAKPCLVAVAIAVTALLQAMLGRYAVAQDDSVRAGPLVVLQVVDTALFVGLAAVFEGYVPDASWALVVVPILFASLRLNAAAVLATWFAGISIHVALALSSWTTDSPSAPILAERSGALLVVALVVALSCKWLQEGWRAQTDLTEQAETRIEHLCIIAEAAREMRTAIPDKVLDVCLAHLPRLGFAAGTASRGAESIGVSGRGDLIPRGAVCDPPEEGRISLTRWLGADGGVIYSAAAAEPVSGTVISAWLPEEIDETMALALSDLIRAASSAQEASDHLARARFEASRDPLTRVANRSELRREFVAATKRMQPVGILIVWVTHLGYINKTQGHLVGDQLLIAIAGRLASAVGTHGLVARYSGDKFLILLSGDDSAKSDALGQYLRQELAKPFAIDRLEFRVEVGVGVGVADAPVDPTVLLNQTEHALHVASRAAHNRLAPAVEPSAPAQHTQSL